MPIKPLSFKGDKKSSKKRKAAAAGLLDYPDAPRPSSTTALITPHPSSAFQLSNPPDTDPTEEDTWVSSDTSHDLTGPILLVLPTHPTPTALACDDTGAVFCSPLENMIEGDPGTAEPHDVRQVWVATQIVGGAVKGGAAEDGRVMVSFKGANGRYLGYGRGGILRAEAVAVGVGEGFGVSLVPESIDGERKGKGMFVLATGAMGVDEGKGEDRKQNYIFVEEPREGSTKKGWMVRGDGEGITETSMLRIRMQARFKPRLKANKEMKAKEKISRRELEVAVGRKLEDEEVKRLKRARRNGTYHEEVLDVRVKGKHDKFAS